MFDNMLVVVLWVSTIFSLTLSALAMRDWLQKKGFWVTEPDESTFFRVVHFLLYDAEERIKKHIDEVGNDLTNEHRIMLIDRIESIKRIIKDK